jgi:hypothetical protein
MMLAHGDILEMAMMPMMIALKNLGINEFCHGLAVTRIATKHVKAAVRHQGSAYSPGPGADGYPWWCSWWRSSRWRSLGIAPQVLLKEYHLVLLNYCGTRWYSWWHALLPALRTIAMRTSPQKFLPAHDSLLREPAFPHFVFFAREFALSSARDAIRTSLMKPKRQKPVRFLKKYGL